MLLWEPVCVRLSILSLVNSLSYLHYDSKRKSGKINRSSSSLVIGLGRLLDPNENEIKYQ